ncbi:MAG: anti-sigma F factor [Eubacteriales bacterium]|nr:anti-sigma F factor [Eubacteriales bacterium]
MKDNVVTVEFIAIAENERFARMVAAAFVVPFDPTVEEITEIKTAVSEAVSNSVIHAYNSSGEGTIKLEMRSTEKGTITIIVEDYGIGIDDIEAARAPMFTTSALEERSGMGFTIMESFTDKLIVESEKEKGTRVTLVKMLDISCGL